MTAAFAAAAVVAVVAILALVLTARRKDSRLAAEKLRSEQLHQELQDAVESRRQAVEERRQAENRVLDAEEARLDAVERAERAEQAQRAQASRGDADGCDDPLLDLERLRVEREWGEVTGTGEPLPEAWDGTLAAAIAAELEIVREVVGVPTSIEPANPDGAAARTALRATGGAARLTSEVVRTLARVGEELAVSFDPDGVVIIRVATIGPDSEPDLTSFRRVAGALGGDLSVHPTPDGFETRLRLPEPPRSSSPD